MENKNINKIKEEVVTMDKKESVENTMRKQLTQRIKDLQTAMPQLEQQARDYQKKSDEMIGAMNQMYAEIQFLSTLIQTEKTN